MFNMRYSMSCLCVHFACAYVLLSYVHCTFVPLSLCVCVLWVFLLVKWSCECVLLQFSFAYGVHVQPASELCVCMCICATGMCIVHVQETSKVCHVTVLQCFECASLKCANWLQQFPTQPLKTPVATLHSLLPAQKIVDLSCKINGA